MHLRQRHARNRGGIWQIYMENNVQVLNPVFSGSSFLFSGSDVDPWTSVYQALP